MSNKRIWIIVGALGIAVVACVCVCIALVIASPVIQDTFQSVSDQLATPTRVVVQPKQTTIPLPPPMQTRSASGKCPPQPAVGVNASAFVKRVTLASETKGDNFEPINPTNEFNASAVFHAVVTIENAPTNTMFKAVWYASDVGDAAACNTKLYETEATASGSRNLDFTVKSVNPWPPGVFRVEISVNGILHGIYPLTVK